MARASSGTLDLDASDPNRVSGTVERIAFHNEENGFCVLRVNAPRRHEPITVTGNASSVGPGEFVEATGAWVNDRKYGLQFRAEHLRVVPPSTLEGIEKYLGSGMIYGIGPHFAARLVSAFGANVFDVIERDPDRLLELPGIGRKRRDQVVEAWAEQKAVREIMVFLQSHGVGSARAVRIYRLYGDRAMEKVRENPYRLALDVRGIGFQTADQIAQSIGFDPESLPRAQAGLRHLLQEGTTEGHCASGRDELIEAAVELLEVGADIVESALSRDLQDGDLLEEVRDGVSWIYLPPLYRSERGIALHLRRLMGAGAPPWGKINPDKAIPWVEKRVGFELSPSQRDAVARTIAERVTVITGGPGVGKTTIVRAVLDIVRAKKVGARLCAPTGRAAKRLTESTGLEASTIHRLLEFDPMTGGFRHNQDDPIDTDFVIVDEVSMVDVVLANQLLRAIPTEAALLLVGDVDQLPSVGPGSVLAEIIASECVPTVRLTEIFRQAESSRIVTNAHRINQGMMPEYPRAPEKGEGKEKGEGEEAGESKDGDGSSNGAAAPAVVASREEASDFYVIRVDNSESARDRLLQVVTERIPRRFGFDPMSELQVLTPGRRSGLGAAALNEELQKLLNPESQNTHVKRYGTTYAPGDKVLQTVNNYQKEVFNGDIGQITEVDPEAQTIAVRFENWRVEYEFSELDELSLAYAITIHKSQGSEFPAVVIPLTTQHYMLLQRNLVYTGVTRGKELVVLVAEPRALAIAVKSNEAVARRSRLAARLRDLDL